MAQEVDEVRASDSKRALPAEVPVKDVFSQLAQASPIDWITTRLGEHLWSKQREILLSVVNHRRTAVASAHSIGKSFLASHVIVWFLLRHKPGEAMVVTSAPTYRQVERVLWREINRVAGRANLPGRLNKVEWYMDIPGPNGSTHEELVAFGQKPADEDPTAFQGIHQDNVLVVFDEAYGIKSTIWEAADTLISNETSKFLAIGNPDDINSEFGEVCKPGSGWNFITVSAFDSPNFTGEPVPPALSRRLISPVWVEEKRRKWGETNPLWISKIEARFPEVSKSRLISLAWIRAAQERTLSPGDPIELGVDVGAGSNLSTIALRRGPVARIIFRRQEPDEMVLVGEIVRRIRDTGAEKVKIDGTGIGWTVCDRLREMQADRTTDPQTWAILQGVSIIRVMLNSPPTEPAERKRYKATVSQDYKGRPLKQEKTVTRTVEHEPDSERFLNVKAKGFWHLADVFRLGDIDIPGDDDGEELAAQLCDVQWTVHSTGKIMMIDKRKSRDQSEQDSPDDSDALMLCFMEDTGEEKVNRRKIRLSLAA